MASESHMYEGDSVSCPTVNRACESCNRKKTKCDMKRPVCGLCKRIGSRCAFRIRQKPSGNQVAKKIMKHMIADTARHKSREHIDISDEFHDTRHSTSLRTMPPLQLSLTPQDGHMQSTTSVNLPAAQARSLLGTDMCLRPDDVLEDGGSSWGVPNALAVELIRCFFENVQPWMSIMHRPLFYERYTHRHGQNDRLVDRQSILPDECIMIYAMFALSARFSKASYFDGTDVATRGNVFAERAAVLKDPIIRTVEEPSLEFVKGCVLLSCHCLASGQISSGAILTSVCVRLAYNLGLNDIDEDQINEHYTLSQNDHEDLEACIRKEELRRVWWAISDLDTFVCTILRQPYGIERRNMRVFLPVSDSLWLEGTTTKSSILLLQPSQTWKSLQNSPHRSARAWFLVSNHLSSCIAEAVRRPSQTPPDQIAELENALRCLILVLPASYQLRDLHIDATDFVDSNWIISTHLMILACETMLEHLARRESHNSSSPSTTDDLTGFGKRFTSTLVNIARVCPPEFIPLLHPIMCCTMINPWDAAPEQNTPARIRSSDLSELLLSHVSRYWKLGGALLRLLTVLKDDGHESTHTPTSEERLLMKHFSILDPNASKRRSLTTSAPNSQASVDALIGPAAHDLPTPNFSSGGSPNDFRWPQVNIWDHFPDFEVDQSQFR